MIGGFLTGTIDEETYTSFTLHAAADDGGMAGPLRGDMNDRDFTVEINAYLIVKWKDVRVIIDFDQVREILSIKDFCCEALIGHHYLVSWYTSLFI